MLVNLSGDKSQFRLFDLIILKKDHPELNLLVGDKGVLVDKLGDNPAWEVEFFDEKTHETKAVETLCEDDFYLV
mgnify:CR=1 FL=1